MLAHFPLMPGPKQAALREKLQVWRSVPFSALRYFALAVFFTFSSVGFFADIFGPCDSPFWHAAVRAVCAGLGAVLLALTTIRKPKWLPAAIVLFVGCLVGLEKLIRSPAVSDTIDLLRRRPALDALSMLVCGMVGFSLFLKFIETEGIKLLRMQNEMEMAKKVQTRLAPPLMVRSDRIEVYGRSVPSSEVGGDLIDVVRGGSGDTCYLADVSGHGLSAGVLMAMTKSAARMSLLGRHPLSGLLQDLDRVLPELKEPQMYVTCALLRFGDDGEVDYSLAGHLPILHCRAKTREIVPLSSEQLPLGLSLGARYETAKSAASTGDIFALLSDGLTEVENRAGEDFGLRKIGSLILDHAMDSLESIADRIFAAVRSHGPQVDDQSILLVRVLR